MRLEFLCWMTASLLVGIAIAALLPRGDHAAVGAVQIGKVLPARDNGTQAESEYLRDSANAIQRAACEQLGPNTLERRSRALAPDPDLRQREPGWGRRAAGPHTGRGVTRSASGRARARLHPDRPSRAVAHADVPYGTQGADAGLHPVGGLVTVLQDAARGAARPCQRTAEQRPERGRDLLRSSSGAG